MLHWTDRHCRYFHRQITRHTWLYTEMITTGALIHGDVRHHLEFRADEHPLALQLGGSVPRDLALCARLGEQWGYDEISLNCGCPSARVQKGAFGACLMNEPIQVADCIKAMRDAVSVDVSVKHRIGIDQTNSYGFVRDFVGKLSEAGCGVFIIHARNAILHGISPRDNRTVPPLRYDVVYRLKQDFPHLTIVLNGGVQTRDEIDAHLERVDGVMLGRAAYHTPYLMADFDARYYGDQSAPKNRMEVVRAMFSYMEHVFPRKGAQHPARKIALHDVTRHMLGLMAGLPGARRFRQILSDSHRLSAGDPRVLLTAAEAVGAE